MYLYIIHNGSMFFKLSHIFFSKTKMVIQDVWRFTIIFLLFNSAQAVTSSLSFPSFIPIVVQASYGENYQQTINTTVEYVFLYPVSNVIIKLNYFYICLFCYWENFNTFIYFV